ncbi:MAG TPA: SusC/RagA family TonB-linked outer membrane protein, partial [Gemmatimonadales bacterium]
MKQLFVLALSGIAFLPLRAMAQEKTVTGKVTDAQDVALAGVVVSVKGTTRATITNSAGVYSIGVAVGRVLQFRMIGTELEERTVGDTDVVINVQLRRVAVSLDAVVVTALGQTAQVRSQGTSQQMLPGPEIVQTQRENFVNALSGRVAGVDVTSTSGVPGASSSITIRGVTSISSNNQPLIIVDGLPIDNSTLNTGSLASDQNSNTALSNRGIDFTNRAADLDPNDIETLTVLKGPEAAALYGIGGAHGAIVITTKHGGAGGGWEYDNSFRIETARARPQLQRVYGPTSVAPDGTLGSFYYFGAPYASGTRFYDNIGGFLRTGFTQTHHLSFSGGTPDGRINYRVATSLDRQEGLVPNTSYDRTNVTMHSQAQVARWLNTDLSMAYTFDNNDQVFKGDAGPLIDLLSWPQTDNAKNYLTPSGLRRQVTGLPASGEPDDPYFNVNRNAITSKNNRIMVNLGLTLTPFSWGTLKTNIGTDNYTNQNVVLRNPQSYVGAFSNGILDQADVIQHNIEAQTILNFNPQPLFSGLSIGGLVGHYIADQKSTTDAVVGTNFLDPNFVSMSNTVSQTPFPFIQDRRVVSVFGEAVLDYKDLLYVTGTGRNDWSSTIPQQRNSFFYPSVSASFILSDAVPEIRRHLTAKLRAAYADAGLDAQPYSDRPSLQHKTTSFGGFGYNFWGPNPKLSPEFTKSWEVGGEFSFLDNRLGLDVTYYRDWTQNQIVNNLRGSYGTGFILFNLNGADTRGHGVEMTLRATPVERSTIAWNVIANFNSTRNYVNSLPGIPESYVSDTWFYGNVRAGTMPGLSTMSLTGTFYLRNNKGQLLIDPTTGLPISSPNFINAGYDRQPDFTIGITNTVRYKRFTLSFLVDLRK